VKAAAAIYIKQGLPQGINDPMIFDLDKFDPVMFDSLSQGLQDKIRMSAEFKHVSQAPKQYAEATGGSVEDMDDDVPF
jgi:hypothetical protein